MDRQEKNLHDQLLKRLFEMINEKGEYISTDEIETIIQRWVDMHDVKIYGNVETEAVGNTKQQDAQCGEKTEAISKTHPNDFSDPGLNALAKSLQKINEATEANKPLFMQELKENAKLPKERIERDYEVEREFGIKEMNCTIRRGPYYDADGHTENLLIRGEITGKLAKDIILLVMVHNGNGEMIEYEEIPIYHGDTSESFSENVSIPKDETIQKITIRPIYRPTEMETSGIWASFFAHD